MLKLRNICIPSLLYGLQFFLSIVFAKKKVRCQYPQIPIHFHMLPSRGHVKPITLFTVLFTPNRHNV